MEAAFSRSYARIQKATGCTAQTELAQRLGIRQCFISDSRRRGEVRPEILLALLDQYGLNPHWVRTGNISLAAGRGKRKTLNNTPAMG